MVDSKCICVDSIRPPNTIRQYPEWTEGNNNVETFRKNGYMVIRGLYTDEQIVETNREISDTIKKWFEKLYRNEEEGNDWEELVNR